MAIAEDIIPGPRIRACGHHIGTTGDMNNQVALVEALRRRPASTSAATGPTSCGKLVREEIRRGVETIKIFASAGHGIPGPNRRNMSRDEIAAVVDDRARARRQGAGPRGRQGDDPRVHRARRRRHRPRRRDRRASASSGWSRPGTFWVPSLVYLWSLLEIGYAAQFGVTREALRPRAGDAPGRAAGRRAHPHRRRLQRRAPAPDRGRPARPRGRQLRPRVRLLRRDRRPRRRPTSSAGATSNAGQLLVDPPATGSA